VNLSDVSTETSDVVLETRVLVCRRLEDKNERLGLERILKSWSWKSLDYITGRNHLRKLCREPFLTTGMLRILSYW